MAAGGRRFRHVFLVLTTFMVVFAGFFEPVRSYERPKPRETIFVHPLDDDSGDSPSPEQVHVSLVGLDKMRVSWITSGSAPPTIEYGTTQGSYPETVTGSTNSYKYVTYHSGEVHEAVIGPLQPNTTYYYRFSSDRTREFSFKTLPSQLPIRFVVIGDLGQTGWTKSTLHHISQSDYDLLLLPGDLSYADMYQPLWDSFGHLVEPLASQRPWMVTQGNHEVEKIPIVHSTPFTSYNSRWRMPFELSGSDSNLYYSFDVPGVHVIMLGSYTDFGSGSAQYTWLASDLAKVDRGKTPWLVVLVHAPWYNTNQAHQNEAESVDMKAAMEGLLYRARVDVVFAGHVHAYERFTRVYDGKADPCGPVYITIGDGGNREGLATKYKEPADSISVFREASFGHGRFEVVNTSHAQWTWHRNDNDEAVAADSIWLTTLPTDPACKW